VSVVDLVISRFRAETDPRKTQGRIELVGAALTVILCVQVAYGTIRLALPPSPLPEGGSTASLVAPEVLQPRHVDEEQSQDIVSRPLFSATRRPEESDEQTDADAQAAGEDQFKDLKLVGTFGAGETAGIIALVKGQKRRIIVDQDVAGWTLKSVEGHRAIFERNGTQQELALQHATVTAARKSNNTK